MWNVFSNKLIAQILSQRSCLVSLSITSEKSGRSRYKGGFAGAAKKAFAWDAAPTRPYALSPHTGDMS